MKCIFFFISSTTMEAGIFSGLLFCLSVILVFNFMPYRHLKQNIFLDKGDLILWEKMIFY